MQTDDPERYKTPYTTRNPMFIDLNLGIKQVEKQIASISHLCRVYQDFGDLAGIPGRMATLCRELDTMMCAVFNASQKARYQSENLGIPELVRQCTHRLLQIPSEINRLERQFANDVFRFNQKDKELQALGYTQEQIAGILGIDSEKPDEATHQMALAKLNAEAIALEAFTRDNPRYDVGLLKGTSFENAATARPGVITTIQLHQVMRIG